MIAEKGTGPKSGGAAAAAAHLGGATEADGSEIALARQAAALLAEGHSEEAEALCRRALEEDSESPRLLHILGIISHQRGDSRQGEELICRALEARPSERSYANSLGIVLMAQGRFDEAAEAHRRALTIDLDYPEAHFNLGNVLRLTGQVSEATEAYRQAISLRPDYAQAHLNLGVTRLLAGEMEDAHEAFSRALEYDPRLAEAYVNLAGIHLAQGEHQRARNFCHTALEIRPDFAPGYVKLGTVLTQEGELAAAISAYRKAVELYPEDQEGHLRLGFSLLRQGELLDGWKEYEWRFTNGGSPARQAGCDQPIWDGEDLLGKRILLVDEQGHGDTLHFIRYAPLIKQRGAEVLFRCTPTLSSLLESSPGIDHLFVGGEELPAFDFQIPLLSLPRVLGTDLPNIPAQIPYLFTKEQPRPEVEAAFAAAGDDFKVGIVWAGNPAHPSDDQRSCDLQAFLPLTTVPGVHVFSLQYGDRGADLASLGSTAITDLGEFLGDFSHTGFIIQELNLVITVDTSMAHLAGALGQEAWVLLHVQADWRWLRHRDDSPWYPTLRLFRQESPGDWAGVHHRIEKALKQRVRGGPALR